jgi:hypothetical protein
MHINTSTALRPVLKNYVALLWFKSASAPLYSIHRAVNKMETERTFCELGTV